MSTRIEELVSQVDVSMVSDLAIEPSYISEIARKLMELNMPRDRNRDELEGVPSFQTTWGDLTMNSALTRVMVALQVLTDEDGDYSVSRQGYDVFDVSEEGESQRVGSDHLSRGEGGIEPSKEWKDYAIVHNVNGEMENVGEVFRDAGLNGLAGRLRRSIDPDVTVAEKLRVVKTLSRGGNDQSRFIEQIVQDQLTNEVVQTVRLPENLVRSDYNDPGTDFFASGFRVRFPETRDIENGVMVEVSSRWVNPIGDPYVSGKLNEATTLEGDFGVGVDVIFMAPNFRDSIVERYEDSNMVSIVEVPAESGSPVIVPDSDEVREALEGSDQVGEEYPVVTEEPTEYIEAMERVNRQYVAIPESTYRSRISNFFTQNV